MPPPFKPLGVVAFVTAYAVSDHATRFKVKYKVETVLVQVVNSSIRCTYMVDYSD